MKPTLNAPIDLSCHSQQEYSLGANTVVKVSNGRLLLHRSFESQEPFFYALHGAMLWWGSCFVSLARQLQQDGIPLAVNRSYLYDYLAYQAPLTTDTLFFPLQFLRVGESHLLDWQSGKLLECQFTPPSECAPISPKAFRRELQRQIAELSPESTVFHISSGLDSSLLALLAARQHGPGSVRLATCYTRGNGCNQELEVAKRIANDIAAQIRIHDLSDMDVFASGRGLIDALGYPLAHPSSLLEFLLDSAILNDGADTIVNGKGPDDCLGGYASHMPQFADVSAHRHRLTVTPASLLSELLGAQHGVAGNFWKSTDKQLSLQQRLHYDARALTDSWNVVHSAIARSLDCHIVSPFMSPTIRNGLFALADECRIADQQQKVFLRKIFQDVYPDYLLSLPKSGFRLDLQPYFKDYEASTLLQKISAENRLFDFVDRRVLSAMIDQTLSGERNYGWQLWSLYLASSSMELFDIS